jgi:RIO kinase 1
MFAPELAQTRYADEIWALFEAGDMDPDVELTGLYEDDAEAPDVDALLENIMAAMEEEQERKARQKSAEEGDDD